MSVMATPKPQAASSDAFHQMASHSPPAVASTTHAPSHTTPIAAPAAKHTQGAHASSPKWDRARNTSSLTPVLGSDRQQPWRSITRWQHALIGLSRHHWHVAVLVSLSLLVLTLAAVLALRRRCCSRGGLRRCAVRSSHSFRGAVAGVAAAGRVRGGARRRGPRVLRLGEVSATALKELSLPRYPKTDGETARASSSSALRGGRGGVVGAAWQAEASPAAASCAATNPPLARSSKDVAGPSRGGEEGGVEEDSEVQNKENNR